MATRRRVRDWTLGLRATRRGIGFAAQQSAVLVTTFPAPLYRNSVFGAGASVRLVGADGEPVLLAGIEVRLSVLGAVSVNAIPQPAVTDANGIATFDSIALTGLSGVYTLIFSAPGYLSATVSGVQLTAGTVDPAQTTVSVPSGTTGQPTTLVVQLRDGLGNALDSDPGGQSVLVAAAGANPQGTRAAIAQGDGTWDWTYTPTVAGTDLLSVSVNGTTTPGSPYSSLVAADEPTVGFDPTRSLRVGVNNIPTASLGIGPSASGGSWPVGVEPVFRYTSYGPAPSEVASMIAKCDQYDILMSFVIAGAPGRYKNADGTYNEADYFSSVDRFKSTAQGGDLSAADATAFTSALARRRFLAYAGDEPWLAGYGGTFTPYRMKRACQYIKGIWPDCLVVARIEPQWVRGWGSHVQMPDGIYADDLPVGYFDKLDYMWCTWKGFDRTTFTSIFDFLKWGYDTNKAAGYGTIFAHNWVNLGDQGDCFVYDDPNNATYTGAQSAHIHGDSSKTGQRAVAERCSVASTDNQWAESPQRIRDVVQAACDPYFADVPAIGSYVHPISGLASLFGVHMRAPEYVSGWSDAVAIGEGRATAFAWRNRK